LSTEDTCAAIHAFSKKCPVVDPFVNGDGSKASETGVDVLKGFDNRGKSANSRNPKGEKGFRYEVNPTDIEGA